MAMTLRFEGGQELATNLRRLAEPIKAQAQAAALLAAAEPVRAAASHLAPRSRFAGPHLADHIVTMILPSHDREKPTDMSVAVGPERRPDYIFWGYLQEFGTAHAAAQAFLRPAFDQTARPALLILLEWLWNAVLERVNEPSAAGRSDTATVKR